MTRTWELYNTPDGVGVYEDKSVGKYVTPNMNRDKINILGMATIKGTIDTCSNSIMDGLEVLIPGLTFDYGEINSVFGLYHHGDEVVFPVGTNQIIGVIVRRYDKPECQAKSYWHTDYVCFIDARNGVRIRNSEGNTYPCRCWGCFGDHYSDINIFVFSYANIDDCLVLGCDVSDNVCNVFNYPECHNLNINWNGTGKLSGVLLDGVSVSLPTTQKVKSGTHTVSVPSKVTLSGYVYFFDAWENGEMTTTRTVNVDKDMTITANYIMPECKEGTTSDSERCWDGSVIYNKVCENGRLVDSGIDCPTQVCSEGIYRCDDCTRYVCRDNKWVVSEENSSKCCDCFTENETKCASEIGMLGKDLYKCSNGKWMLFQSNASICGYVEPACVEGSTKKQDCPDGTSIITHNCTGGKWVPTNKICPTKPVKPVEEWYDWFTQETIISGVPNYAIVATGITVPVVIGVGAYLVLRKPKGKRKK